MAKKSFSTTVTFFLLALLTLTFVLRIYHLDWIQFDSDFGRDSLFGWRILTEKFTLLGAQASVGGFYLGPFYFYLVALLYALFGPIPEIIMLTFAVMNVTAAWLGFRLLSSRSNLTAGCIFLMLFATQPMLIISSRAATHSPMLPLLTVLAVTMLMRSVTKPSLPNHFLAGATLGLFLHVHFSALLLFPGYFLAVAGMTPGNWTVRIRAVILQIIGMGCMLLPLVLFDLRHHFITSRAFVGYLSSVIHGESVRATFPHWTLTEKIDNLALYIGPHGLLKSGVLLASAFSFFSLLPSKNLASLKSDNKLILLLTFLTSSVVALLLLYPSYLFLYYLVVPGTLVVLTISVLLATLTPRWIGGILALLSVISQLTAIPQIYVPEYRTMSNLTKVVATIEADISHQGRKPFSIFKDSSDGLTALGYEYRFLLTRDGFTPVTEYDYAQAEIVYVIREDGTSDPLTLGGHEMSQFQPKSMRFVQSLDLHHKQVDIFALTK